MNRSPAPASIVLPRRGVSQVDSDGGIFYDPAADNALFEAIRTHASAQVDVIDADLHINDPAFAQLLVSTLLEVMEKAKQPVSTERR